MQRDWKQIVVIGLLIANLIVSILIFSNTKQTMNQLSSEVDRLREESYQNQERMADTMANRLQSILQDSRDKINSFTTTVTDIAPAEQTAELRLDFEVQDVSGDGSVFVLYKTEEETGWSELEAVESGPLTYEAGFTAELDGNYEFKIVNIDPSGASVQLNAKDLRKNLYDEFYERRTYIDSSGRSESRERFSFDFSISNNSFGLEEYRIQSVIAKVLYIDTVLFDGDITHLNQGNPEEIARRNLQIASGQPMEEGPDVSVQDANLQRMLFVIELDKEELEQDYPDLLPYGPNGFLQEENEPFRLEIKVVYSNGEEKQLEA